MSARQFFSSFSFVLLWCLYPSSKSAPPQTYGQGASCASLGYDSTWCLVGCLNGWCCATASGCGLNGCGTANCCYLMVGESITCGSKFSVSICHCWSPLTLLPHLSECQSLLFHSLLPHSTSLSSHADTSCCLDMVSSDFAASTSSSPCRNAPPAVANGDVSRCAGQASGSTCTPTCSSGYIALSSYTCNNGRWIGVDVRCNREFNFFRQHMVCKVSHDGQRTDASTRPAPQPTAIRLNVPSRPADQRA